MVDMIFQIFNSRQIVAKILEKKKTHRVSMRFELGTYWPRLPYLLTCVTNDITCIKDSDCMNLAGFKNLKYHVDPQDYRI